MGVYGSTSLVYLDDDSEGLAATRAFLARRIDDVMRFEKVKAQWRGNRDRLPSLEPLPRPAALPGGLSDGRPADRGDRQLSRPYLFRSRTRSAPRRWRSARRRRRASPSISAGCATGRSGRTARRCSRSPSSRSCSASLVPWLMLNHRGLEHPRPSQHDQREARPSARRGLDRPAAAGRRGDRCRRRPRPSWPGQRTRRRRSSRDVTPAKAGVQDHRRCRYCCFPYSWVPAFAGMTGLFGVDLLDRRDQRRLVLHPGGDRLDPLHRPKHVAAGELRQVGSLQPRRASSASKAG